MSPGQPGRDSSLPLWFLGKDFPPVNLLVTALEIHSGDLCKKLCKIISAVISAVTDREMVAQGHGKK